MTLLGRIVEGPIRGRPPRVMVYGEAGVGKSTFASEWPDPLFLDAEKRTEHLDIKRIEINKWPEVLDAMREIYSAKEPPCKTLVLDTIDHMELMIFSHLCETKKCKSIEDYGGGFGKGYTAAQDEWRTFILALESLRSKGIACLLLAHGHVKTFKNPLGEDYDKWQLKMNAKSANFLREKMDAVGFAHFEDMALKKSEFDKAKGKSSGERLLSFEHSAAFESKQGISLPDEIPLRYAAFIGGDDD